MYSVNNKGFLAHFPIVVLGIVIFYATFGGALKYYLFTFGLGILTYLPSMLFFCTIMAAFFQKIIRGRNLGLKDLGLWLAILISLIFGLLQLNNIQQVLLGFYILFPFIFGMSYSEQFLFNINSIKKIMFLAWVISLTGLFLDYSIDVPWRGFEYEIAGVTLEGNRDWTTFGVRRLSGFARASFDLSSILFVSSLCVMSLIKNKIFNSLVFVLTAYGVFLTTSKGIILSLIVVFFCYLFYKLKFYKAIFYVMLLVVVLQVLLPVLSWLNYNSNKGNIYSDDILLQSMGERVVQMWPDAFNYIQKTGTLISGGGLGSIGVPLDIYGAGFRNAADNMFLYMYSLIGVFAFFVFFALLRGGYKAVKLLGEKDDNLLLIIYNLIGVLVYGLSTDIFESGILGLILGFCFGVIFSKNTLLKRYT